VTRATRSGGIPVSPSPSSRRTAGSCGGRSAVVGEVRAGGVRRRGLRDRLRRGPARGAGLLAERAAALRAAAGGRAMARPRSVPAGAPGVPLGRPVAEGLRPLRSQAHPGSLEGPRSQADPLLGQRRLQVGTPPPVRHDDRDGLVVPGSDGGSAAVRRPVDGLDGRGDQAGGARSGGAVRPRVSGLPANGPHARPARAARCVRARGLRRTRLRGETPPCRASKRGRRRQAGSPDPSGQKLRS
jgi:hypothetical protein